jgi:hypothetical protein
MTTVSSARHAPAPLFSVDGFYIATIMHHIEASMAIATGLWALIDPQSFVKTLCSEFLPQIASSHAFSSSPAAADTSALFFSTVVVLLTRMASNGILLAGALKVWVLRPCQPRTLRWRFVQAEVVLKSIHLAASVAYAYAAVLHTPMEKEHSGAGLSRLSFGTVLNLILSSSQLIAVVLTVMHEVQNGHAHMKSFLA